MCRELKCCTYFVRKCSLNLQRLHDKNHVLRRLVDPTLNVVWSTIKRFVLVFPITLAALRLVVQNVSLARNVHLTRLALTTNVRIHVRTHAVLELNAQPRITTLSVHVPVVTPVILSLDAHQFVSFYLFIYNNGKQF